MAFQTYIFINVMLLAASSDAATMRIHNFYPTVLFVAFFPWAYSIDMSALGVLEHTCTAVAFLLVGFILFSLGFLGGGDAKLIAAGSLWLGLPHALVFLLYSAIAGGVLAIVVRGWTLVRSTSTNAAAVQGRGGSSSTHLPYGIALAAGAILSVSPI